MPVVSVALLPLGREGEFQAQMKGLLYELVNRHFTLRFQVQTDNILDGPQSVLLDGVPRGLPAMGDSYFLGNDSDEIATCTHLKATPQEVPTLWHVEAQFDTDRLVNAAITNPLNLPAEVAWDSLDYDKPMFRDLQGVPCCKCLSDKGGPNL